MGHEEGDKTTHPRLRLFDEWAESEHPLLDLDADIDTRQWGALMREAFVAGRKSMKGEVIEILAESGLDRLGVALEEVEP